MRLWLLGPLYAWLLPGVMCWNKRISASLRNIAYAPERDYEWTRTAETKYYKRGGNQVSPGSIPYFSNPTDTKQPVGKLEDSELEEAKRAWAGPGDIGFYKRGDVGSFDIYKRLHDAEDKKATPGSFGYYKRGGPGSFGMYKRGNPGSFGFYKRGNPGSFGFYKRGTPGAFAFYKRANPGDFGMYKRANPGDFGMYKRANPGNFALYKRDAQKNRRARPGDVPIWKRTTRAAEDESVPEMSETEDHVIHKRSVGDFGLYKKGVGDFSLYKKGTGDFGLYKKKSSVEDETEEIDNASNEEKSELNKELEEATPKQENENTDKSAEQENVKEEQAAEKGSEFSVTYHVIPFPCKLFAGDSPMCYHNGIGPRVTRDKHGVMWCECACPEGWKGPECRERA